MLHALYVVVGFLIACAYIWANKDSPEARWRTWGFGAALGVFWPFVVAVLIGGVVLQRLQPHAKTPSA